MPSAFERLHPGVQRWLYDQNWRQLRPIQVEAIQHVLGGDGDLIVAARTAGGKTEAAFLPILSSIADEAEGSVRAMYVGPLRALINDQFRRMELLCGALDVGVHRWHGDVGQSAKSKLLSNPSGVLLITPESLEGFFVRRQSLIAKVFARLSFVVIDELHVFPGSERGMHLRSLLNRLEQRLDRRVRRVGLSATLGDLHRYQRWLRPSKPDQVALINHPREGGELKTRCYGFPVQASADDESGDHAAPEPDLTARDRLLLAHHLQGINLVFANAKRDIEEAAFGLRALAEQQGKDADRILVHHGSLSRDIREDTEHRLQGGGNAICCCSSTLELGLDIGDVRSVAHLEAPWSVASLAQRLGRSGRREGEPCVFRQYHRLTDLTTNDPPEKRLRVDLVRGIALVRLYLDGWCESADVDRGHQSTLVHQIISVIAETGGVGADGLYRRLAGPDGFGRLSPGIFAQVLRHLGQQRVIEQLGDGTLLLAAEGERELADRGFYAVFTTADEYTILQGERRIGSLSVDNLYRLGDGFRLAGRGWEVEEVDEQRLRIFVRPSMKKGLPKFAGSGGGATQDRVVETMRAVLSGNDDVAYVDEAAAAALVEARALYRQWQLDSRLFTEFDGGVVVWPWRGTRVLDTLQFALRACGLEVNVGRLSLIVAGADVGAVREAMMIDGSRLRQVVADGIRRAPPAMLWREKFDKWLPTELLVEALIEDRLDVEGACVALKATQGGDARPPHGSATIGA